jgi:hypothetical protein
MLERMGSTLQIASMRPNGSIYPVHQGISEHSGVRAIAQW